MLEGEVCGYYESRRHPGGASGKLSWVWHLGWDLKIRGQMGGGAHSRETVHPSIPLMGALDIISIHPPNNFSLDKNSETDIKVDRARNR